MDQPSPTKKVLSIVPEFSRADVIADARRVLAECADQEFESVIVFGFKDRRVYTRSSKSASALEIVGALAVANKEIWK